MHPVLQPPPRRPSWALTAIGASVALVLLLLVPTSSGIDCPLGEFPSDTETCLQCPIGTYGNAVNSCSYCTNAILYTDARGQTSCKICGFHDFVPEEHPIRQNVNDMDALELRRFRRALKHMQQPGWASTADVPEGMSPFEFVASTFGGPCSLCDSAGAEGGATNWRACGSFGGWSTGGSEQFGEWNRAFMLQFDYWLQKAEENILQGFDPYDYAIEEFPLCPQLAAPYWPWSDTPGTPIDLAGAIASLAEGVPLAFTEPMVYVDNVTDLEPNPMYQFTTSCGKTTTRSSEDLSALGGLSRAPYQIVNAGQDASVHSDLSTATDSNCSGALEGPSDLIHVLAGGFLHDDVNGPGGLVGGSQIGYHGVAAFDPLFFAIHSNADRLLESWYSINDNRARSVASFEQNPQSPQLVRLNIPAPGEAPAPVSTEDGSGNWHDFCQAYNRSLAPTLPFRDGGTSKFHVNTWSFLTEIAPTAGNNAPCSDETSAGTVLAPDGRPYYTTQFWVETPTTHRESQYRYDALATWATANASCARPAYEFELTVAHTASSYLAFVDVPAGEAAGFHSLSFAAHTAHPRYVGMVALFKASRPGATAQASIDATGRFAALGITSVSLERITVVRRNIKGEQSLFEGPIVIHQPANAAPAFPAPAKIPHPAQGSREAVLGLEGEAARIVSPSPIGGAASWIECSSADRALFSSGPIFVDGVDVVAVLASLGVNVVDSPVMSTHGVIDELSVAQLELEGGESPTSVRFATTPAPRSLWPYPSTAEAPGPGGFVLQGDLIVNGTSVLQSLSALFEGAELPRVAPAESLPGAPSEATKASSLALDQTATSSLVMCQGASFEVELAMGSSGDVSVNAPIIVQGIDIQRAIDGLFG